MKLAAIDIGSNSIKLVVVDAAASDSFAVITREKEFVRLGHQTLRRGHISHATIDRAVECLQRFRSIAEVRGAESIIATATASVREANNSSQFVREVEQQTGIKVEVLSGIEEARLIGLAASQSCSPTGATNLNLDIGGGSTEISVFREGVPLALFSVDLGAIGLTEKFLKSDPPKAKELGDLRHQVQAAFERPARELRNATWQQATGTSGTILALGAALRSRLESDSQRKNQPAQPSEFDISLGLLLRFNVSLASLTVADRKRLGGLSAQRSEIIIAGGQILEGAMRALRLNSLLTCEWALREGVIIDRLRELEAESRPPVSHFADPKMRSVHAVGRRFGYEEAHSLQVARLAEKVFDSLAPSEEMTRHQRTLLSAAALLHDIGKIRVPDAILRKPGKLTEEEWVRMRNHPLYGQQMLSGIEFLEGASRVVGQHHEKWDGSGYPWGLAGEEIDLNARIFAVADAFDAMISDRVYRAGKTYDAAAAELTREAGNHFDPQVVEAFHRISRREWEELSRQNQQSVVTMTSAFWSAAT